MEKLKVIKIAMAENNIKNFTELAKITGDSRQNLHNFLRTLQIGQPREETLQKYATALKIPIEKLK